MRGRNAAALAAWLLLGVLYLVHGFHVFRSAVDAPFWDDWALVQWEGFGYWQWLLALHIDHPLLFTKLLVSLQDALGAWDVEVHRKLNWLLYGAQVVLLGLLVRGPAPPPAAGEPERRGDAGWAALVLCGCMLSTLNMVNHEWVVQTSYHLFVICLLSTALALRRCGDGAIAVGGLALAAAPQTLAAGMMVTALGLPLLVWRWARSDRAGRRPGGLLRWGSAVVLGLAAASLAASAMRYLRGGSKGSIADSHEPLELLRLLATLVGRGFTPRELQAATGAAVLVGLALLAGLAVRRRRLGEPPIVGLAFALLCALGFLSLVAYGRGSSALVQDQYAEVQALLPALLAAAVAALVERRALRLGTLLLLLALALWGYRDEWRYRLYEERATAVHRQTVECAARGWRGWQQRNCVWAFPEWHDFSSDLRNARREETALYLRTRPGDDAIATPVADAVGWLQTSSYQGRHLVLEGWSQEAGTPRLRSNGRWIAAEHVERHPRRQLARRRDLPESAPIGLRITVDRDVAPTAELDGVEVYFERDGVLLRVHPQFTVHAGEALWADGRRLGKAEREASADWVDGSDEVVSAEQREGAWEIAVDPPLSAEELAAASAHGHAEDRFFALDLAADPATGALRARLPPGTRERPDDLEALVVAAPHRGYLWIALAAPDAAPAPL
ncbi:MAG: hypothetical protein DWQ36_17695 [Acidobacteria bacterium]|nr:MAG: hypothetical protein DWQ30_15855 [Acidobacteriota bacterium]REK04274.1 MAG: hypothetical protein DWQ36_17695 [Acidobacteriota bacterium]